jgi:HD-like signal output (HDOD) protein
VSDPLDIDYILSDIVTLPSLPGTITRVLSLLDDPNCSMHEVGQLVSTDPAIALKTLRLINSAQYGTRNKVTSVEQAVVLLGAKVIKNLVLSAAVFEHLSKGTDQFLSHSISCGIAMEMLAEACPRVNLAADEAFVYGVLHDVGMIIYQEFMPDQYTKAMDVAIRRNIPLYEAEQEIIGVDHAELGGRLAQQWHLPDKLIGAIAGHHDLSKCTTEDQKGIAALLSVADYICNVCGISSGPCPTPIVSQEAWASAGFLGQDIPIILEQFYFALPNVDELVDTAAS